MKFLLFFDLLYTKKILSKTTLVLNWAKAYISSYGKVLFAERQNVSTTHINRSGNLSLGQKVGLYLSQPLLSVTLMILCLFFSTSPLVASTDAQNQSISSNSSIQFTKSEISQKKQIGDEAKIAESEKTIGKNDGKVGNDENSHLTLVITIFCLMFFALLRYCFRIRQALFQFLEHKSQEQIANTKALAKKDEVILNYRKDLTSILSNVSMGIFVIDKSLKVESFYSSHLKTILEQDDINGKDLGELIFKHSTLGDDEVSSINTALKTIIDEDPLVYELNNHIFPTRITYEFKHLKYLELSWDTILNDENKNEKLLVSIRDITDMATLQKQADEQNKLLKVVQELLVHDRVNFYQFYEKTIDLVKAANGKDESEETLVLGRAIHTIKGNARLKGFVYLSNSIHKLETQLAENELLRPLKDSILNEIEYDFSIYFKALKMLDNFVLTQSNEFEKDSISYLMMNLKDSIKQVAEEVNKPIPEFKISATKDQISEDLKNNIENIMVHLLNNSMTHGIEPPSIRENLGKPPNGLITIDADLLMGRVHIVMSDDGQGLNLKKLKEIGCQKKTLDENSTENEIANSIFLSGTTTSSLSKVAGRGMGMDAVKAIIEKENGFINILLDDEPAVDGFKPFKVDVII